MAICAHAHSIIRSRMSSLTSWLRSLLRSCSRPVGLVSVTNSCSDQGQKAETNAEAQLWSAGEERPQREVSTAFQYTTLDGISWSTGSPLCIALPATMQCTGLPITQHCEKPAQACKLSITSSELTFSMGWCSRMVVTTSRTSGRSSILV